MANDALINNKKFTFPNSISIDFNDNPGIFNINISERYWVELNKENFITYFGLKPYLGLFTLFENQKLDK